jgi:DNA-binding transcriptional LysR family regulator
MRRRIALTGTEAVFGIVHRQTWKFGTISRPVARAHPAMTEMNMDWGDVRVFLAIARCGTLGAAARQLGQTQPTMGRRLRALENAVGQTLFQRTADGFVLTDEGHAVLSFAQRMEEEALAFTRSLAGTAQQLTGSLRVSSSDWFGIHVLTPVFAAFLSRHPQLSIELITDSRRYSLSRREADLVFRITPFDEPDVIQRKIMDLNYALYGHVDLVAPHAGDGAGQSLITMDSAFETLPDVTWIRRMLPNARVAYASNNRGVQARMCAEGGGFAVLPCALGDNTPGLRRIDLGEAPPGREVWFGYHRDLRRLGRLRALIDVIVEKLANA